jgi:GntR family transcriptional regulator, transcriptional repressor for pyruvate dehydrogenase complex
MTMQTKLRRETLAEQIAQSLARFMEEQQLAPGEMLPSESKLAADFGVSRPIIREALKSLAAQGIIVVANGKGAMVRPLDSDPLLSYFHHAIRVRREASMELLELRRGIELQNAQLAAQRRTAEEAALLGQIASSMRSQLDEFDAWTEHDAQLHLVIARATHNEMIYHLTESIREPMKNAMREGFRHRNSAPQREQNQQIHEQLVAAIQEGNAAKAFDAMGQHFDIAMGLLNDTGTMPA